MRFLVVVILALALLAGAVFYFASVADRNAPRDATLRFEAEIGRAD